MSKLNNWGDFFGDNRALFDDDYNHGQSAVFKLKSKATDGSDYSVAYKQGQANTDGSSKIALEGKVKDMKFENFNKVEGSLKNTGECSGEGEFDLADITDIKGLSLFASGSAQAAPATK